MADGGAEETERDFQRWVTDLATWFGWRWWHDVDSRRNFAGLPDLILARRGRLIFAELKRQQGQVRPEQAEWLAVLGSIGGGVEVHLWRPADRAEIERILR